VQGNEHAVLLRREDAKFKASDLHPKAYESSRAMGCSERQQVGYGTPKGARVDVALLWSGSAESVVELRASDPKLETTAYAIANGVQVGYSGGPGRQRAMLWRGSSNSVVELHPKTAKLSECHYTDGSEQVGTASANFLTNMPSLWHGSADSWVDLTPKNFPAERPTLARADPGRPRRPRQGQPAPPCGAGPARRRASDLHAFVPKQVSATRAHSAC
jgi:hypothetical protein